VSLIRRRNPGCKGVRISSTPADSRGSVGHAPTSRTNSLPHHAATVVGNLPEVQVHIAWGDANMLAILPTADDLVRKLTEDPDQLNPCRPLLPPPRPAASR
jgi:hypothetical protein